MATQAPAQPKGTTLRAWRHSMQARVMATTLLIGLGAVALLGAYIISEIRDGLVENRVERLLAEGARDATSAQERVDASPAETPGDLQSLVDGVMESLRVVGGSGRGLVLLQAPQNDRDTLVTTGVSNPALVGVITPDIRAAVNGGMNQPWQFVELPEGGSGIVVGSPLRLTVAGEYELYFVYSLAEEEQTLNLIQRILALGATVLVAMVLFIAWSVTLQAVRPVRQAARVASRLADGMLFERMPEGRDDEMAILARTFNNMAERLQGQIQRMERLSRLQRRFVSDVSHELRTPLTTIRMASDVLYEARGGFDPAVARSAELLQNQIDRFEALLSDLLEISRFDAGAERPETQVGNFAEVVRDEVSNFTDIGRELGVSIRLWVSESDHSVSMDAARVARIVRNLLSNALEHAQGKPIDIAVAADEDAVAVMVRDYGVGMNPQQVERVFDRFWRADPARTRTMGGTGLGLSIAREDAQLHGGAIDVWGSPGHGASFRLTLPRMPGASMRHQVLPLVMREREFVRVGPLDALSTNADDGAGVNS